jgi:hypothetical protein
MERPRIHLDVRSLYDQFDQPVTEFDCGEKCRLHNPSGKPFCCDICHAVPVAFSQEWEYLRLQTDLWHLWRGNECPEDESNPDRLRSQTPEHLLLMACKGPAFCERNYRASSCRQFPFFPYITSDDRFIGLSYEWEFESTCWVISHLHSVTAAYRREFIQVYDDLFTRIPNEFDSYAGASEEMRDHFASLRRGIPLLHRNGKDYLLSPQNERLTRVDPLRYPRFGFYRTESGS